MVDPSNCFREAIANSSVDLTDHLEKPKKKHLP